MIFYRKGAKPADRLRKGEKEGAVYEFEEAIDFAVFPSLQVRCPPALAGTLGAVYGSRLQSEQDM